MRTTKDSGERDSWETGAHRDTGDDKADLLSIPLLLQLIEAYSSKLEVDDSKQLYTDAELNRPQPSQRHNLIHPLFLQRLQELLERGAEKYDEWNWLRGIPLKRNYESLFRHALQAYYGDTTEDHLAAVAFNAMSIMVTEHLIYYGERPRSLADAGYLKHHNSKKAGLPACEKCGYTQAYPMNYCPNCGNEY